MCIPEIPGGTKRLSLSAYDKLVRDWPVEKARNLRCNVRIDEMGSTFAIWSVVMKWEEKKLVARSLSMQ